MVTPIVWSSNGIWLPIGSYGLRFDITIDIIGIAHDSWMDLGIRLRLGLLLSLIHFEGQLIWLNLNRINLLVPQIHLELILVQLLKHLLIFYHFIGVMLHFVLIILKELIHFLICFFIINYWHSSGCV